MLRVFKILMGIAGSVTVLLGSEGSFSPPSHSEGLPGLGKRGQSYHENLLTEFFFKDALLGADPKRTKHHPNEDTSRDGGSEDSYDSYALDYPSEVSENASELSVEEQCEQLWNDICDLSKAVLENSFLEQLEKAFAILGTNHGALSDVYWERIHFIYKHFYQELYNKAFADQEKTEPQMLTDTESIDLLDYLITLGPKTNTFQE